jgi:hypothetical protein
MSDYSALVKYAVATGRQKREPTKLECGMLGALLASFAIAVAILFWLGTQG